MSKNTMKKIVISLLAVVLTFGAVKGSLAYFTDYEENAGTATVILKGEGKIIEEIDDDNKHITIKNTGETPIIVRVRIFANAEISKTEAKDPEWKQSGDWWYYSKVIPVGGESGELYVEVTGAPNYQFDITVIMECERVTYDADGNIKPLSEGWTYTAFHE